MKFSIEKKISKKSGNPYVGLFCGNELITFVSLDKLYSVLFKNGVKLEEVESTNNELTIKNIKQEVIRCPLLLLSLFKFQ